MPLIRTGVRQTSDQAPEISPLTRREFVLLGLVSAGGAVGSLSSVLAYDGTSRPASTLKPIIPGQHTPIRNPAFRWNTDAPRSTVVYCWHSDQKVSAYRLNGPASAIWFACLPCEDYVKGKRKPLDSIVHALVRDLPAERQTPEADTVRKFVGALRPLGLVLDNEAGDAVYEAEYGHNES